ncbi:PspA/IM30 family protein [Cohnella sp. GCM10012308]|uniref:PspA/IM30 family protein n=1 Tax=Cohnella sp. GCM10012308 TaxID=3317329 RepID=UPI0036089831
MGLIRRLRHLFGADRSPGESPERILNAYIEASSEALRELSATAKRVQSDGLVIQEKMSAIQAEMKLKREQAEEAAQASNAELARRRLEEVHDRRLIHERLQEDANRNRIFADELLDKQETLSGKIQTAKAIVEQYQTRSRRAASLIAAEEAASDMDAKEALNRLQADAFLAEAKAELERSRPY